MRRNDITRHRIVYRVSITTAAAGTSDANRSRTTAGFGSGNCSRNRQATITATTTDRLCNHRRSIFATGPHIASQRGIHHTGDTTVTTGTTESDRCATAPCSCAGDCCAHGKTTVAATATNRLHQQTGRIIATGHNIACHSGSHRAGKATGTRTAAQTDTHRAAARARTRAGNGHIKTTVAATAAD